MNQYRFDKQKERKIRDFIPLQWPSHCHRYPIPPASITLTGFFREVTVYLTCREEGSAILG